MKVTKQTTKNKVWLYNISIAYVF